MKTIAFDLMGNDNGIKDGVNAAIKFINENLDYKVSLIGDAKQISKYSFENERIEIIDQPKEIKKGSNIKESLESISSMSVAIDLVKDKKADAVLSSGDSASYLALAIFRLKRLPGVQRPAFMTSIPTLKENKNFVLLDVGANLEVTAEYLVQWAKMASIFYQIMWIKKRPSVAILNIGTEDYKGFAFHKEAHQILKSFKDMNYKGFIEPRDVLLGNVDVIVSDGYGGNIILKTLEGSVLNLFKLIKKNITSTLTRKLGALLLKKAFSDIKEKFDYRNIGAAWIIGVDGLAIKSHGSSDEKAFLGAFNQIKIALENDVLESMKEIL